jgi:arylsulfatase
MKNQWPDGGASPFRKEKDTNFEGAFRVPCVVRWPGVIKPGTAFNDIVSAEDWLPTLVAAAGDGQIKEKLLKGHQAAGKTFKVHIDGYNQMPYFKGEVPHSPRNEFVYFDDDGNLVAYREGRFKFTFDIQYATGMNVWRQPMTKLRAPLLTDLRSDPFEEAFDNAANYEDWFIRRAYLVLPAVSHVGHYLATFKEFPPRQRPASFSIDQVTEKLQQSIGTR